MTEAYPANTSVEIKINATIKAHEQDIIKLQLIKLFSDSNPDYKTITRRVEYVNKEASFVYRHPFDVVKRMIEHIPSDVVAKNYDIL
ncbi:MAG: hypothetical protein Edafosvirus14_1, partial [Edafosvirus sp.]